MGLHAWQKMLGQIFVTGVFAFYVEKYTDINNELIIPFLGKTVQLSPVLYVILMFFIILGTVNGANFTDGLDGLASSVTVLIATFFAVVAIGMGSGVTPVACAVVGSLLGFLVYNVYPAKVFMGDTGSLALGGFVASIAYMLKMPIFIVIVAFIYFCEVLSVIIQVASFKLTGKRVFRMAPIHHHFELGGWPETKVVAIFSIVTAILCVIGLLAL
jgi:phospho-N-acetylmuramoyl-pentapeptide-transferase